MSDFRVEVDPDLCGGHGECLVAAPDLFDFLGDDDVVSVTRSSLSPREWGAARDAEARCPNAAIRISGSWSARAATEETSTEAVVERPAFGGAGAPRRPAGE